MRHFYDDENTVSIGYIICLIALVIGVLFLSKGCQTGSIQDEFNKASSVVVEGVEYDTDDVVDVYSNGELYDTTYTLVLKDGTKIKFKTYTLKYDN